MTAELRESIAGLYSAFSAYARREPPDYGETSDPDGYSAPLRSRPLALLRPDDLGVFAWKAMTTWGSEDDFRHYLPRIFELVAEDPSWTHPEAIFGKLAYARWQTWPKRQRSAVDRYLHGLWREAVADPEHPLEIDTCLCSIGRAVDDISPYLREWKIGQSAGEAMRFAALVESVGRSGAVSNRWKADLGNAFWQDRPIQRQQVTEWLLSDERVDELESAFFKFSGDPGVAAVLSDGMLYLQNLRGGDG